MGERNANPNVSAVGYGSTAKAWAMCRCSITTVERVNARIKDDFGARRIHVRGHAKVLAHLMFGVLALTAEQLMRWLK